jgi:nicotinamide-nucleotide amidase
VGLVCFSVAGMDEARLTRSLRLPGGRADIRERSTTVAMHLVRRLLQGERDGAQAAAPPAARAAR